MISQKSCGEEDGENRQINVKHFAFQANAKVGYMHENLKHSVISYYQQLLPTLFQSSYQTVHFQRVTGKQYYTSRKVLEFILTNTDISRDFLPN